MTDIAELGIKVDSRDAATANERLGRLVGTGGRAEAMTGKLTKGARGLAVSLGAAGVAGAAFVLQKAFRKSIQLGKEFTVQLSDLSAITGIAGDQLDGIGERALQASEKTGRSATEIVEAYKLVASQLAEKIDFSTASGQRLLQQVSEDAVTLSQAARIDLAQAVEATTTAINQFNLAAGQSREVINNLAAGSKFGAAEVANIQAAMQEAGSAAAGAGEDITTTNAAIQVLAANAITGSRAGTGLRQVFLRLQTEADKLAKHGITDVNIKSDGLTATLRKLTPLLSDAGALTDIFGQEAFNAASLLIKNVDSLERLEGKLGDTNTATEQAAVQMDNLTGDIARLSRAVEADLTRSFQEGESTFRAAVQEMQALWNEFGDDFIGTLNFIVGTTATEMKRWRGILAGEFAKGLNLAEDSVITSLAKIDSRFKAWVVNLPRIMSRFGGQAGQTMREVFSGLLDEVFPEEAARQKARDVMTVFWYEAANFADDLDAQVSARDIVKIDLDEWKQTWAFMDRILSKTFKPSIEVERPTDDIILPDGTIIPADSPTLLRRTWGQFNRIEGQIDRTNDGIDWGEKLEANIDDTERLQSAARDLGFTFSSAFEDAIVGGRELSSVLQGLLQDILRIIVRTTITRPLGDALAGFLSGGGGSGAITGSNAGFMFGGTSQIADALITKEGKIIRGHPNDNWMAFQGNQPPGSAPNVNVNIINETGAQVDVTERQGPNGLEIEALIRNAVKSGLNEGAFDGALNKNFRINRKGRGI